MSEEITSLRIQIQGFVQGVGFRDFLMMTAQRHRLDGWVRNVSDGSVEALVSGPAAKVEAFVGAAAQGPRGALVRALDLHNADPPATRGFKRLQNV
ncbi:MAG: acylphosphatase [Rhizomicrobium sp.]